VNHPTNEELCSLTAGQLSDDDLAGLSAHLGKCSECCRRLDQLASDDPLLAKLQRSAAGWEEALVAPAQRRSAVRALRHRKEDAAARTTEPPAARVKFPPSKQVADYDILTEVGRGAWGWSTKRGTAD
jgi:anti-sigma factor RsiW